MKTIYNFRVKNAYVFLILIFLLISSLFSQTPQYYNLNTGTSSNSFPFNMPAGKGVNSLFLAGEFNQPSPIPAGQKITTVYFRMSSAGTRTFTSLQILMAQDVITTLTSGTFYPGPYDTVFNQTNVTCTSSIGGWMSFTLDHAFNYDPAKSLILFVGQCGYSGTGGSVYNSSLSGIRRVWSVGGCPLAPYASGDGSMVNFGVDVVPAVTNTYYFTQWCPTATFPNIPSVSIYGAGAVLGDTLYFAIGSADGATGSTLFYKYSIVSHAWTTGTPLPTGLCQATLTKCGTKLYHIGGSTAPAGTAMTNIYEYSPATGQWTSKSPMPGGKNGHNTVNWGDSVLIVACGPWATPNNTVYCYRPASDSWATCTNFSGGISVRSQAGGIVGNKIYIAGGYPFTNQLVIGTIGADATQITWAAGPPFPSVTKSRLGGVGLTDRFYIIGGNNSLGTTSSDSTFVFNVNSNIWSAFPSVKPTQVHNVSNSVVAWGTDSLRIACLGGSNNAITAINAFDVIGCGPVIVANPRISKNIPANFTLLQNYPNPFNPTTKIIYSIPKSTDVKLVVYDILGREVKTLVNETKPAGKYEVEFNGLNFASGVYFYKIQTKEFSDVKKMLLLK